MNKTIYRIVGIFLALALTLGSFSNTQASSNEPAVTDKPVYAYYYLWWSSQHWKNKLGSNYPYSSSPLPLPSKTDIDGCNAVSNYTGNQLLDVPTKLVSQDEPGAIENDIRTAKNAGISGFWLNWSGNGSANQIRTSVTYTPRLAEAFAASARVGGFKNWVSYKAASMPPPDMIINDLNFLYAEFKNETAWERIDGKPVVTFTGSRKYSDADVLKISNAVRDRMYLVGDESRATLTTARIAMFDAVTYYWSSQDPFGNPASFNQIKEMGDKVHAAGKLWFAPINPGYNSSLLDGGQSCTPRRNGDTIRSIWNGNSSSKPDGWGFISWNEIAENTHIKPMQKWGSTSLNVLSELIGAAPIPSPTALSTQTVLPSPTSTAIAPTATLLAATTTAIVPTTTVVLPTSTVIVPTTTLIPASPTLSIPTIVPTLTSTSSPITSATTLDDKDPSFVFSPGWQNISTSKANGGSYKETTQNGAAVTLTFTGQSFSILYKGGITYSKFDIYVDGTLVGTLDQKMSAATYNQRWDYPTQLPMGTHTLNLVFKVTSTNINRGSFDAVIIR